MKSGKLEPPETLPQCSHPPEFAPAGLLLAGSKNARVSPAAAAAAGHNHVLQFAAEFVFLCTDDWSRVCVDPPDGTSKGALFSIPVPKL